MRSEKVIDPEYRTKEVEPGHATREDGSDDDADDQEPRSTEYKIADVASTRPKAERSRPCQACREKQDAARRSEDKGTTTVEQLDRKNRFPSTGAYCVSNL